MTLRSLIAATLVHVLTASGIGCAFMAVLALIDRDWQRMFSWLGVALVIDAIDGPFARRAHVKTVLPRFDGERLDLIIDYVTYVFIPALAMHRAGILPGGTGMAMCVAIAMSSLFHFSDTQSKTDDNCFVGFPAIWNVVALYLFAYATPPWMALLFCLVCVGLTFVPVKWVHPVRVRALRPITALMSALWAVAAIMIVGRGFPAELGPGFLLAVCGIYGVGLSIWHGRARL